MARRAKGPTPEELIEKLQKDFETFKEESKERMDEIRAEKKKLDEQEIMLKTSLAQTESEQQRMDQEKANVLSKNKILETSIMNLHTKTKAIRDDICMSVWSDYE